MKKKNTHNLNKGKGNKPLKTKESKTIHSTTPANFSIIESAITDAIQKLNLDLSGNMDSTGVINISKIFIAAVKNKNHQLVTSVSKYGFNATTVAYLVNQLLYNTSNFELIKALINGLDNNNLEQLKAYKDKDNNPLLHVASALGREEVVKYLIEDKKFDVNQPRMVRKDETPLHTAVMNNKAVVVKTLLSLGAQNPLTTVDPADVTPMHTAVLQHNVFLIKLLGGNDDKLIKKMLTESNKIKNTGNSTSRFEPISLTDYSPPSKLSIVQNEYYNVLFGQNKEMHANNFLKLSQDMLSKPQANDPNTKEIVNLLIKMSSIYTYYEDKLLRKFLLEQVEKIGDSNMLALLYNKLSTDLEYIAPIEARDYIQKAITISTQKAAHTISLENLSKIYLQAAKVHLHYDEDYALECLMQAEKYDIDNKIPDILRLQHFIYTLRNDTISAKKIEQKIPGDTGTLLKIHELFDEGKISSMEMLKQIQELNISASNSPAAFAYSTNIAASISTAANIYKQTIETLNLSISNDPYNYNKFIYTLDHMLTIFHTQNDFKGGLEYLQSIYTNYPHLNRDNHNNLPLTYHEFLMYEANGLYKEASIKLEHLHNYTFIKSSYNKHALDQVHKIRFANELELKNFDKAEYHLSFTSYHQASLKAQLKIIKDNMANLKLDSPPHEATPEDTALIDAIMESATSITPDTISTEEKTLAVEDKTKTTYDEDPYLSISPKDIHNYFQRVKAKLIKQTVEAYATKSDNISWILPNGDKMHLDGKSVIEIQGKINFYAIIDPTLLSKISALDSSTAEAFVKSLEKGVVSKNYCSNGVKFLNKHRAEIKIDADLRIYSTQIYQNENGKYLLIFDKDGNHKDVAKALQNTKVQVESVLSDKEYNPYMLTESYRKAEGESSTSDYSYEHYKTTHSSLLGEDEKVETHEL